MSTSALDVSSQALSPGLYETLLLRVAGTVGAVELLSASRSATRSSIVGSFGAGAGVPALSWAHRPPEKNHRTPRTASPPRAIRAPDFPRFLPIGFLL